MTIADPASEDRASPAPDDTPDCYKLTTRFSQELITLIDQNYIYQAASDAYCRAVGRSREEIVGHTVADLWGEQAFRSVIKSQIDLCLSGQTVHEQNWIEYPAWGWRCMDLTYYPHPEEENTTQVVVVARDITRWVQAESHRDATLSNLELSHRDLAGRVAELETLHQVSVALSSVLDLSALLDLIVEKAAMLVGAEDCSILLPDPETGELVFHAGALVGMRIPAGKGIAARVLQQEVPQIVYDVTTDADHYPQVGEESGLPTRSVLAVPLLMEGHALGVLEAVNKRRGRFTSRDQDLLVTLASHAAVAIENARLFEQIRHEIAERKRAEKELQAHRAHLEELVAARTAELTRINEQLRQEIAQREQAEAALRESEAQYRLLAENMSDNVWTLDLATRTFTYVSPAVKRMSGFTPQEVIGQTVDKVLPPHSVEIVTHLISESLIKIMQEDTDPTDSMILELEQYHKDGHTFWAEIRARFLFDQEGNPTAVLGVTRDITDRKRVDIALNRLLDLSRELGSTHDLETALRLVVHACPEIVTNADQAALQWLQEDGETLSTVATSTEGYIETDTLPFREGVGVAGHVLQSRRMVNVPDVLTDERFIPGDRPLRFRSLLVAPLLVGDRTLGTLSLSSRQVSAFSPADETLVHLLTDQISSFLENTRYLTARLQAEAERAEALDLLQTTINGIGDPILLIDDDYQIKLANKAARENYAYEEEVMYCYQLSHQRETPCDGIEHLCPLVQVRQTLKPATVVHEHTQANGETRLFEIIASPLIGEDGELTGIVEATRDITERVRAEAALRESEERYRLLVESAPLGILSVDSQGNIIDVNPAMLRILGSPSAEATKSVNLLTFPPLIQAGVADDVRRCLETGEYMVSERLYTSKWGRSAYWRFHMAPILDQEGNTRLVQIIADDITERKRAEAELRKLTQAVEQSANTVVITDLEGNIEYVNPKFVQVTGYTVEEALGQNPRILKSGEHDESYYRNLWQTITAGREWHGEFHNKRKDGTLYWERATIAPVHDAEGRITHFIAVKENVTAQKEAEEALHRYTERVLTLYEISQDILGARSPEEIARATLIHLQNLIPCSRAGVTELPPSGSTARILATLTNSSSRLGTGALFPIQMFQPLQDGRPRIVQDTLALAEESAMYQTLYAEGIRSHLIVPLIAQGQLIGALHLGSSTPNAFTTEHREVAIQAATMLAVAIQQARLYEQTRRDAITKADLLKEVNHRVKNNLMAIGGLLLAEQRYAPAESRQAVRVAMQRLLRRIEGLAQVHTMLSASQWQPLPLSEMASQLIHTVLNALPPDRQIEVSIPSSSVKVSPRQASNLALIINELVTNSIKYAVGPGRTTRIAVQVAQTDDEIIFEYRDNGPGYPEEVLRLERHDVGLYLIQRTVRLSLNGTLTLHNDGGAVTTIRFKMEEGSVT